MLFTETSEDQSALGEVTMEAVIDAVKSMSKVGNNCLLLHVYYIASTTAYKSNCCSLASTMEYSSNLEWVYLSPCTTIILTQDKCMAEAIRELWRKAKTRRGSPNLGKVMGEVFAKEYGIEIITPSVAALLSWQLWPWFLDVCGKFYMVLFAFGRCLHLHHLLFFWKLSLYTGHSYVKQGDQHRHSFFSSSSCQTKANSKPHGRT